MRGTNKRGYGPGQLPPRRRYRPGASIIAAMHVVECDGCGASEAIPKTVSVPADWWLTRTNPEGERELYCPECSRAHD